MKKTAIVIVKELFSEDKAIKVKNFSDENVKEAIGKLMKILPEDLQCLSASMSGGLYGIKKHYRGLKDEVKPLDLDPSYPVIIQVSYGDLYE